MSPVRDLIASLPDWVSVTPDQWPAEAAKINEEAKRVGRVLTAYALETIRSGIQEFALPGTLSVEDAGRLLLLDRLLYEVPEWSPSVGFFGGFVGPRVEGGQAQIGWPFDDGGTIVQPFRGYLGDEFQALSEFDRFRALFPRRIWPS